MNLPDIVRNGLRAALLDVDLYERVEHDATFNRQVVVIVLVASLLGGVGSAVAVDAYPPLGAIAGVFVGFVGWVAWSALALWVGTRFLGGTADFGEMARVIGFSFTPLMIGVVPWLGFVGAAWALVATVVAIREGLDVSTGRAFAAMVPGWIVWLLLSVLVYGALGLRSTPIWPF
jgi:hypothetical protein